MAVKEEKINIFKTYHPEIPLFPREVIKSTHKEKIPATSTKSTNESPTSNLSEQALSWNIKSSKEKLIKPLPGEPDIANRSSIPAEGSPIQQLHMMRFPESETTCNSQVQISETLQTEDIKKYCCPYLDHVSTFDPCTGERYSDPEAKKKEIIEEMKLWEVEDIPNLDRRNNPKSSKCETSRLNKDTSGNSTQDVNKIKVDCPHCKRNVLAVRFVPHLSKCMGVHSRRSCRLTKKK